MEASNAIRAAWRWLRRRGKNARRTASSAANTQKGSAEAEADIGRIRTHTMAEHARLVSLHEQVQDCERRKIPGALAECGTWKGGAVGLMALANLRYGAARRHIHLFDSFEGIPEPDPAMDGDRAVAEVESVGCRPTGKLQSVAGFYEKFVGSVGTLADNRNLLENVIGYPPDFLHYHVGWFQDTLPQEAATIGPIAVLRLDGDWYASTKVCLDHLYDHVVDTGIVVIDDFGTYEGCKRAVLEFRQRHHITAPMIQIDYSAYYWVKERP